MKLVLGLCFFCTIGLWAQINPWNLLPQVRMLTRKEVSHIVVEKRKEYFRVTLLVSERFPYNYKSQSFPLFFRLDDEKKALDLAIDLDKYLDSGKVFTVELQGSEIRTILWGEP